MGGTITAAIPPVFEAYATVVLPHAGEGQDEHDRAVLALLSEQSTGQPRWLGYLDTGADDIVFPDAPKVTLYPGWHYVLVEGGPGAGRHLAPVRRWVVLEGRLAQLDVPSRPLVAGVDAVGRRLELHRRASPGRKKISWPPLTPKPRRRGRPRTPRNPPPTPCNRAYDR